MICAKGAGESAFQPKRAAKNGSWKASIVICATNKVASVGGLLCTMASLDVASWHFSDVPATLTMSLDRGKADFALGCVEV